MFGLRTTDLGRLLQDLELSYRPVELRSHLQEAYRSRALVRVVDVPWPSGAAEPLHMEIQITPLLEDLDRPLGASLAFLDHTRGRQLRNELERTNQELETMNEELQSTNDELRALNDQLQQRTLDLNEVNGLLQLILGGLRGAVVVLGPGLAVEVWSPRAEDLWGVRPEEAVGTPFRDLDLGIPVDSLAGPLQACLDEGGEQSVELAGVNRRGKPISAGSTARRSTARWAPARCCF